MELNEESNISSAESVSSMVSATVPQDVTAPATPSTSVTKAKVINSLLEDTRHKVIEPKDVIEYEWPYKSGEKWFLQEHIGELLDIKSFSRKYPDMIRRKVERVERDWLCTTYNIQKTLNETQLRDLCAMRAVEIHDLMTSEYPFIYQEYQRVTNEKLKALMFEQAKEMEAIKNDSKKLAELREKAIKSALEFNKEMVQAKKLERQHFWDIQTSMIQSAGNKWKKLPAKYTKPDPYPVALILGQYQTYYKRFEPEEMRRLPLGSVLEGSDLFPVHRDPSPPPISVTERDMQRMEKLNQIALNNQTQAAAASASPNQALLTPKGETPVRKSIVTPATNIRPGLKCTICGKPSLPGQTPLLRCATCSMYAHPTCLEIKDDMVRAVLSYSWNCIDCRGCSVCEKKNREGKMILCDGCDRGFHVDCIGLTGPPKGRYICDKFCINEPRRALVQVPEKIRAI